MVVMLSHYLFLSALLFSIGAYGVLSRKSALSIYMCIELMLNSANINLVAFSRYLPAAIPGWIFVLFIIAVSAAEFAAGIAIIILVYRNIRSTDVANLNEMKG